MEQELNDKFVKELISEQNDENIVGEYNRFLDQKIEITYNPIKKLELVADILDEIEEKIIFDKIEKRFLETVYSLINGINYKSEQLKNKLEKDYENE